MQQPSPETSFLHKMQKMITSVNNDRDRIVCMTAVMSTLNYLCQAIESGVETDNLTFDINDVIIFIALQADRTDAAFKRKKMMESACNSYISNRLKNA